MRPVSINNDPRAGTLEIVWSDGTSRQFEHAHLRSRCNCAECRALRVRTQNALPVAPGIRISEMRPVGAYGMQLLFSDGHDRGIYPWTYLHELGVAAQATRPYRSADQCKKSMPGRGAHGP